MGKAKKIPQVILGPLQKHLGLKKNFTFNHTEILKETLCKNMNKYLFTPKKNFLSIKTMIEIIKGMVRFKLNIYGVIDTIDI